jgi:hypothetical protein
MAITSYDQQCANEVNVYYLLIHDIALNCSAFLLKHIYRRHESIGSPNHRRFGMYYEQQHRTFNNIVIHSTIRSRSEEGIPLITRVCADLVLSFELSRPLPHINWSLSSSKVPRSVTKNEEHSNHTIPIAPRHLAATRSKRSSKHR